MTDAAAHHRGHSKCSAFTFGWLSCRPSLYTVDDLNIESEKKKSRLTFNGNFGQHLTGADVVGGYTFVGSAVVQSHMSHEQLTVLRGLSCRGQTGPAHPAPLELNGVRAVCEALQLQGVSGPETHLVRQAGGVRRS